MKRIYHSRFLVFMMIFSFFLLVVAEAIPNNTDSSIDEESKPVVRVKEGGKRIPAAQKEKFERLIEEGKKLFKEEMDFEGAIRKFKEAQDIAINRDQKADVLFYLSLAYYVSVEEKGREEFNGTIRQLIEADYYRELDELLCPPGYVKFFQEIKKEYGVLRIQSNPSGADVYLGEGKDPVGKTPLTIGRKAGLVRITVKKGKKEKKDLLRIVAREKTSSATYNLKGRSSLIYILGGLVLAGATGAYFLLKANEEDGASTGRIQVNSSPAGAKIFLDGGITGKTTNHLLTDVSPGNHTITLFKEGYVDYEENVSVTAEQTVTINANLAGHTIEIIRPKSSTIWTKGEQVEIKWNTLGDASNKGNLGLNARLDSASKPRRSISPRFRSRDFRANRSFRSAMNWREDLVGMGAIKDKGFLPNNALELRNAPDKLHSPANKNDLISQRGWNLGITRRYNRPNNMDSAFSPRFSPRMASPLGEIETLTLTKVKIELYKESDKITIIVESTSNDASYAWTVDQSLADGTDYRVRISCADDPNVYGESKQFAVSSGYEFATKWGTEGRSNNEVNEPQGIAVDGQGNVYVADTGNNRIVKFSSEGKFIKVWGSYGYGNYQFREPRGVAIDKSGNVYVADSINNRVVKFTSDGNFITQWGSWGSGDYQFLNPKGLDVDGQGNIFVADTDNHRIMKFTSEGNFVTKWGKEGNGNSQFQYPRDLAVDDSGNVYVADTVNYRIQKFNSSGTFIKKWGRKGGSISEFDAPFGVAVDNAANVYVADTWNHRVQKFTSDGKYITRWGSQGRGTSHFVGPLGIAASGSGSVYVSDTYNHRIMKFTSGGSFLTKWGSSASSNFYFKHPKGIAVDSSSRVYVADSENHRIMKYSSNGGFVRKWEVVGESTSQISRPQKIAFDGSGNVYVTDNWNHRILKYSSSGTLIMQWGRWGSGNYEFDQPMGIAVDSSGNVYVAEHNNYRIMKFSSDGKFLRKWGSEGSGNSQFRWPYDVAVDNLGNVYVADHGNDRIAKFTSTGKFIKKWGTRGSGNNEFAGPSGVAVDSSDNIYVSDMWNHRIIKFTSDGEFITKWGSEGSGNSHFIRPFGLAVDASGNVYVADTYNNRIMKFRPVVKSQQKINNRKNFLGNPLINSENTKRKSILERHPIQRGITKDENSVNKRIKREKKR